MAAKHLGLILRHLRRWTGPNGDAESSDGQLLHLFVARRDQDAFAALVERHGPMVLGVCRRIMHDSHDAEDVFQAAFLILARKASSLDSHASLAPWLYTVAYRLALRARRSAAKRNARERQVEIMPAIAPATNADSAWRDLRPVIDEELSRLPEKYRAPLVLCYLEGRTYEETARQLGWPKGTVAIRLARGRDILRQRLTRRGITLGANLIGLELTGDASAGISSALLQATVEAATSFAAGGTAMTAAVALAQGALHGMVMQKLAWLTTVIVLLGSVGAALGVLSYQAAAQPPKEEQAKRTQAPSQRPIAQEQPKQEAARVDQYGDPLPEGAVARLGTVRFRHGRFITALTYNTDGKRIASAGFDQTIRFWDSDTGKELRRFEKIYPRTTSIAISPDGQYLAASVYHSFQDRYSCIFDLNTGREFRRFEDHANAAAFSPDGKWLAAGVENVVHIWDWRTGQELRTCEGHQGQVFNIRISVDGRMLVTGASDGTVRLWDAITWKELRRLDEQKQVNGLALSPDGKTLAIAGSADPNAIHLWDVATGKEQLRIEAAPEKQAVNCFAFSPDGKRLASATGHFADSNISLWDPAAGKQFKRIAGPPADAVAIAFSPDGQTLAAAGFDNVVRQWDVATGVERKPLGEHLGHVEFVAVSPDGVTIATGCRDQGIRIWEAATGKKLHQYEEQLLAEHPRLAFSPDGRLLASANNKDLSISLWDPARQQVTAILMGHSDRIDALRFLADGRTLLSWSREGMVRRWDWTNGKALGQTAGPPARFYQAVFSPDGVMAFGAAEGAGTFPLYLWDTATGAIKHNWSPPGFVPESLAFAPDGQFVAAGGDIQDISNICIWQVAAGTEWRIPADPSGKRILAVAFSPDSKTVAAGCRPDLVLYETATRRERVRLRGHQAQITSLAFAPNGRALISGSEDTTAIIWDLTAGAKQDGMPIAPANREKLWTALANQDAAEAYRAMWRLVAVPAEAVALCKERLRAAAAVDPKRFRQLVADLDSDQFAMRTKAAEKLEQLGDAALPPIRQALSGNITLEARRRLQDLQAKWEGPVTEADLLRTLRAIEVLEHIGTAEAKQILAKLAAGAPGAMVTQEAKASLERLAK